MAIGSPESHNLPDIAAHLGGSPNHVHLQGQSPWHARTHAVSLRWLGGMVEELFPAEEVLPGILMIL